MLPASLAVPEPGTITSWPVYDDTTFPVVNGKYSANVPVPEFLSWLAELGTSLVIEFPTRDDRRVGALLMRKKPGAHPDYDREAFERALAERFDIVRSEQLSSGTRVLYHAQPR